MRKLAIGLVIRQFMEEKNLTPSIISDRLGISRQAVYQDFNKTTLTDDKVERYAKSLDIDKDEIYERWNYIPSTSKTLDSESHGDELLMRLLEKVEALNEQLKVKDKQIGQLIELLGKTEGACYWPFGYFYPIFFGYK